MRKTGEGASQTNNRVQADGIAEASSTGTPSATPADEGLDSPGRNKAGKPKRSRKKKQQKSSSQTGAAAHPKPDAKATSDSLFDDDYDPPGRQNGSTALLNRPTGPGAPAPSPGHRQESALRGTGPRVDDDEENGFGAGLDWDAEFSADENRHGQTAVVDPRYKAPIRPVVPEDEQSPSSETGDTDTTVSDDRVGRKEGIFEDRTGDEEQRGDGGKRKRRRGGRRRKRGRAADAAESVAATAQPAGPARPGAPAPAASIKSATVSGRMTHPEPDFLEELDEIEPDEAGRPTLEEAEDAALEEVEEIETGVSSASTGTREMIINASSGDECRIAVLHEGRLEELFMERESTQSLVQNIYKGRVTNVEPSIQAAFVEFGLPKQGFLHISDVQPQYFPDKKSELEEVGRKTPRANRPPIQQCLRRGQEVIVQVTKDGVGTKGPTLTTYISIPGRFLVMMPGMSRHGVSRKIEDDDERRKMKQILGDLSLPQGMGFILRTAGMGQSKRELQRDLNYLMRLWRIVKERVKSQPSPAELYRESDLVTRTLRDVYSADFRRIVVDEPATAERVEEFLKIAMPRTRVQVEQYADRTPVFHRFRIEEEIEKIHSRHVPLRSGGSLIIDSTEAMVTIDVNSGKFRSLEDAEETAFKINMEAAEEIARQLRLRDLGGLIVCDFIDMRFDRHCRQVERALRDALKKHKERARVLRMSAFGLIELTRQRQGPSLKRSIFADCPHCKGTGLIRTPESVVLDAVRLIQLGSTDERIVRVIITVSPTTAIEILNRKREIIHQIEKDTGKRIIVQGDDQLRSDEIRHVFEDVRGQQVTMDTWHIKVPDLRGRPPGHSGRER